MTSRIHDGGKRLQFGTGSPTPAFRHPYEKYGSRVSDDSFRRASECDPGRGPDSPDLTRKRSFKNGQRGRKGGRKGLDERNTLICQTFLSENPFFGAYYPAIRPRSAEEVSNKGSDRSRSPSTDFDDSKTYKIIYTGNSICNEDQDSLQGKKLKKTDDIHHFHEHHHFFHDKNDESSNSTYYDKYQYAKAKEQAKSSVADPNKSFLKQPIQESCMIYQVEEDPNQRFEPREPKKDKSQEGARHLSRSSSKSGKRSSGNETYTVVCEHCQKLLRDHPNARIVGHENIPERLSGERGSVPHGYNRDSLPKATWKATNTFVAEPQYQVQRLNVSQESARWRKGDRANVGPAGKPFIPFNVGSWPVKSRENVVPKVPSSKSSLGDSDSRSLIFKCDHCKSIIETKPRTREKGEETSSSSSSKEGRGFDEKSSKMKSVSKENSRGKPQVKGSVGTKRSSAVSERKSFVYKGPKGSRTLVKKMSSSQRVSGKVSSQKLSKSYTLSEKKKSSLQRTSRPSRLMDRRNSGSRGSKEANGAEKRSSSYSATRDTSLANETRSSRYKERRALSEMSKKNGSSSKGLRESRVSGKRISSAVKESRDSNESKQKSSVSKEPSKGKKVGSSGKASRESAPVDKGSSYKKSITTDKKTCSTYTELGNTCSMNTRPSSNRKESKDSTVKRFEKTESNLKKVETEKARLVQTEDRSMQTSSKKLVSADQVSAEPKRSSTASKSLSRKPSTKESKKSGTAPGSLLNNGSVDSYVKSSNTRGSAKTSRNTIGAEESKKSGTAPGSLLNNGSVDSYVKSSNTRGSAKTSRNTIGAEESRKSGTAPGSLLNNGSIDPYLKSSATRGSATISRRTVASKESPVVQVESTPEAKQSSRITGIQTEITDLKTQLDRLEALHNMKTEALDSSSNPVHEAIDCPKHPIVVCTSTTYIMTKCLNDFGDRKTAASTPREPEKIPSKEKESAQKFSGAEEASGSKCQRFCCSEVNSPQRVGAASAEKTTAPGHCLGKESSPFKKGPPRASCQFVGSRITRALNKVCHCPNRDLLSRYCDTPGRARSCDRDGTCRWLFGNGKNQRRAWLRGGLLTSYCNSRERKNLRCCPKCYNIAVADVRNSLHRSYSDGVGARERLIAYQSYSRVLRDYDLHTNGEDRDFQKGSSKSQSSRNDVQIDDTSRPGYFLRTSISDICEYRNGSLIRLIGKSGWVVYTKKLFLQGKEKRKNTAGEEDPKNLDEFAIFPASTSSTWSKSVTNVKKLERTSDATRESRSLIYLNQRHVWSDSSIYLHNALRTLQLKSVHTEREKSTSSVYLRENVRAQNRGITNFNEIIETRNNELYLLDCKSAADRNAKCADTAGNGLRCTCRRRRRKIPEGQINGAKPKKEKVPVLFEGVKSGRDGSVDGRHTSDVSVKYVFAEKLRDSERANKVIWSTDGNGSRIKRPYLFGVSKIKKNRRNREHFSMNDKQRKYRWHRSTSQKKKENSYGTNKPEGDSPQNRCACCNCNPNHPCSHACGREEEELTGIRKLLKDIGITGLTLGFSKRATYCRPGLFRPQNTEEEQNERQNVNYYEDVQTEEKGEVEVTEEVKEEVIKDEIGSSVTYLKKVSAEDKCCDCAKQLEQLLNQTDLCNQLPSEPASLKEDSWEDDWNVGSSKDSSESTKNEPSFDPHVLDDISLQRRRITECENLLRRFEIQLEDVKRQKEAYTCKCEETPRQEVPQRQEEPPPTPQSRPQDIKSSPVQNDEVELQVLAERKCPIAKDDGYIRFEGKILTQLTSKRSTKSIGCGVVDEEHTSFSSPVQTARKVCMVKNATQMTSDIFLRQRIPDSEHFINEINLDVDELCSGVKKNSEECVHRCSMSGPKVRICCERTMCTCEKCCNIHFVDKHYLPANSVRKWHDEENKVETATYVARPRKEIFTNTSVEDKFSLKRDEYTSLRDLVKSKKTEEISTAYKPRKEEVTPVACRPTKKDESTWTSYRPTKDEGTSAIRRAGKDEGTSTIRRTGKDEGTSAIRRTGKDEGTSAIKRTGKDEGTSAIRRTGKDEGTSAIRRTGIDEATSTVSKAKKDEATSTTCRHRKEENSAGKAKREETLSHKETPRVKVEVVPLKAPSKATKDEERRPARDEIPETDRSRFRKESKSISEEEMEESFVNQSDLEKTPSEEENGDESSSKDLSRVSSVKSRAREVICECSKTSATEKCEDNVKCECASKGIQCAERRKMKRFCECGSKLKLIEDRLRALEERKRKSESTISSPKERKETTEESSAVSEKIPEKSPSESSIISEKEQEAYSEAVSSSKAPEKETSEDSSLSYPKEKQLSEQESNVSRAKVPSVRAEAERAEIGTTESSSLTEKSSSLENIESETDTEIKTKVITCHNMNFFDGGDPNVKTKCKCMEDSFCPFKNLHNQQDLTSAKNIFFVTNIDLLRQWSGMYGCGEYSYCKHFWHVNESALKPVKLPRDWRNVKTAVASFFRSCKLGRKKFTFKRRKKSDGESSADSVASRSDITSASGDSFLDDCSRSSMPLKRRSFHVLAKGPRPTRPVKERAKTGSDKKRRKRSRKRKIHS